MKTAIDGAVRLGAVVVGLSCFSFSFAGGDAALAGQAIPDFRSPYQRGRSCGINCVYAMLKIYGVDVERASISNTYPTGVDGMSVSDVVAALTEFGLPARAVHTDASAVERIPLPAIAHHGTAKQGHFVVLLDVDIDPEDPSLSSVAYIDGTSGEITEVSSYGRFLRTSSQVFVVPIQRQMEEFAKCFVMGLGVATMALWLAGLFCRIRRHHV